LHLNQRSGQRRITAALQPATSNQQPATGNQQPATSNPELILYLSNQNQYLCKKIERIKYYGNNDKTFIERPDGAGG
jgi:hypothetical protein